MSQTPDIRVAVASHETGHGSLVSYTVGFVLSVVLTLIAFLLVVNHLASGWGLLAAILGLAMVQLVVQVFFFLHLGKETSPRWNLLAFLFMLLVVAILVFCSLWIMSNLSYHMSSHEIDTSIIKDEGLKP